MAAPGHRQDMLLGVMNEILRTRANPCNVVTWDWRFSPWQARFDSWMSISLPNPNPGLTETESPEVTRRRGVPESGGATPPGFETLQALLAFSSLHEQIRQRRVREEQGGAHNAANREEPFRFDEMLQMVAERALNITGADGVAIALAEGENKAVCCAAAGSTAPPVGAVLDPYAGFSGACFRTGQIVRCDDAETDPRVDVEACRALNTRAMVAVPINSRDETIGILEAFSSEAYGFNDSDIRSLNLLAELVLSALRPDPEEPTIEPALPPFVPLPEVRPEPAPAAEKQEDLAKALEPMMPSLEELQAALKVHERDHTVAEETHREPDETPMFASNPHEPDFSWLRPALVVLGILLALGIGATIWLLRPTPETRSHEPAAAEKQTSPEQTSPAPASAPASPAAEQGGEDAASGEEAQPGAPHLVTGVRHWSSVDSSTVVVDLQDQVQYEAHRLTDPERIYFDLHDTVLGPGISRTVEIGDALLVRVRLAQLSPTVTRVVLETKGSPNFSVSLEAHPYRLVVEVTKIGTASRMHRKLDLFAPLAPDSSLALATPGGQKSNAPLSARSARLRIALDAGHGGWDLGTTGRSGLVEKDLTLDIVARLGLLLEKRLGAEVIYTRQDDTYIPLEKRTEIANLSQADAFVSIHANYSDLKSARGVETYYSKSYSSINARGHENTPGLQAVDWTNVDLRAKVQESRHFALDVQRALYHKLSRESHGSRNRGVKEASYVVLTGTTMPAILAEVSFVSSPDDEAGLQNSAYRQQIAEALYEGIAAYNDQVKRVNIASSAGKMAGMH